MTKLVIFLVILQQNLYELNFPYSSKLFIAKKTTRKNNNTMGNNLL